ncbi:PilW family protein [Methylibium sp.]|uniref:PilW family protein n=1 Tax=Methylibium sp. TaxID=2067992 RepID=UPI003D0D497D
MKQSRLNLCAASSCGREHGFTMVELMVAIAVGLIVTLAVTGAVLTMGRQFRITGANVAAQGGAQIALSLMDEAGRSAGVGMFSNGQALCPTLNAWYGGTIRSNGAVFMPARITDGGSNTASDTVTFTGTSAAGALSGTPVLDNTTATSVRVSNAGNLQLNDLAVIGAPGSNQPCSLFQITATPTVGTACGGNATGCKTLTRAVNSTYNPGVGTFTTEPSFGFSTAGSVYGPAVVNRLGTEFRQDAFAVQCGSLVQYNAFTTAALPACTAVPLGFDAAVNPIAMDVVLMHAQYGISSSSASDIVTGWVDATGTTWATPSAADAGRIKAVRVVLVTRSKEPDNTNVTAAACTNEGGVVNTGPCSFADAGAPVIDLSAVSVPTGRTWRNFRYRVHQAIMPLRNVIWSN